MLHGLVGTDNVSLPGMWVYFCSAGLLDSGIVGNVHLRNSVVKEENVGKLDLQGVATGSVEVWALSCGCGKLVASHLHLACITTL